MDYDSPLVKQRGQVNPYFVGAQLILKRMLWDLYPQSWISRKRLLASRDRYQGQKAVILCNGPSLNKVDFDLLMSSRVFSFGLNKINLLFRRTVFRPDAIVAVNHLVLEQNADYFNSSDIDLYLDARAARKRLVKLRPNVVFLHSTDHHRFSKDVSFSLNQGFTVTATALQLAFHLGFSKVALVGADHSFAIKGAANKTVTSGYRDESHFDPSYFSGGEKWQLPDLFESEVWYGRARQVYEAYGRQIFNCTDGGKLEVFERQSLDTYLAH